jgi:hypothetical protein
MRHITCGKWGLWLAAVGLALLVGLTPAVAQKGKKPKPKSQPEITYPPKLPGGKLVVTDRTEEFLKPPASVKGVAVAKEPPTVDFAYFPGQDYPGKPWSAWGDSLAANGKYYASIGDHLAPAGNGLVFEYDPATKKLRKLLDLKKLLNMPAGHYAPAKIHSRLDLGSDGWLYCATHRGSPKVTNDTYHYKGDWIVRVNPTTGKAEVVVQAPVPKHCIPCSVLDPKRLIFYGGTAPGEGNANEGRFFAYDIRNHKVLYAGPNGPSRYMILAKSTGKVYFNDGKDESTLLRFDPEKAGPPEKIPGTIGIRAATEETPQGIVYTVSQGGRGKPATLYAFNTKTEKVEDLGPAAIGSQSYIASLDADPTGRYLYYNAGAHGGAEQDGTAVVQFDTKTRQKKVIAFLDPFYKDHYGAALKGTYSSAVDPKGDRLYVTWNVSRGSRAWDCCGLTVIHIPESERQPR